MKRFNKNKLPLQFKLLMYFLVFGAIILIVLWVFQSFFLKPFYTISKSRSVQVSAEKIAMSVKKDRNVLSTIDNVASNRSLTVHLYQSGEGILRGIYKINYDIPAAELNLQYHEIENYYNKARNSEDGIYTCVETNSLTDLATLKMNRLKESFSGATSDSVHAEINYHSDAQQNESMVYAEVITLQNGQERFLLVTSSITPLSNTIDIIRGQLILVSIVFVLLSLIFSVYASRRIARPIAQTNRSAKELARKKYDVDFNAKGYLEVSELNDTLNFAKTELAATEKLQQELIANISHDLRTPLTMITGYGEVMRDLPGENTPENIQIIIDEATRLSTLVNDLLDLSKLQSGALRAEKSEFCLTDSIRDIFTRYRKLTEQDGYTIAFMSDEDVYINADELRVSQVIYNLVNNAVNHAGEDKTVIVTQLVHDKKVRIEVTDHGEGIPADKLPLIWDRYYKVDKEHRRGVIGSGLGLSIVKTILDAHGARYGVRSTEGKGSTFWFEMPVVRTEKQEK